MRWRFSGGPRAPFWFNTRTLHPIWPAHRSTRRREISLHFFRELWPNPFRTPHAPDMNELTTRNPRTFPSTCWSTVREAGQPATATPALDLLLQKYLEPLVCHLIARFRLNRHQAEDLLQAFMLERVLARKLITHADCT